MSSLLLSATVALAGTWRPARTLYGPFAVSSPPEPPVVSVASTGDALAAWDSTGDIRWSARAHGGAWWPQLPVPGAVGYSVDCARGSDGTGAIAWVVPAGEFTRSEIDVSIASAGAVFLRGAFVAYDGAEPEVAVAGDGTVFLAWSDLAGVQLASIPPGGVWSSPEWVSTGTSPQLAVNDVGDVALAWTDAAATVWGAVRPAGGAVGPATLLSTGSAWSPDVTLDQNGDAAVGFVDGTTYRVARHLAGAWAPAEIASGSRVVVSGSLDGDDAGNLAVALQVQPTFGNVAVFWAESVGAAPWTAGARLSALGDVAGWPTIAVSPDSTSMAVTWVDDAALVSRAVTIQRPVGAAPTAGRLQLGGASWGSVVPVDAGGGTTAAVWAVQDTSNPNSATIQARVHE